MKKFLFILICIGLLFVSVLREDVRAEEWIEESKAVWEEIVNNIKIPSIFRQDEDDLVALKVCGGLQIEKHVTESTYPDLDKILELCFMGDEYAAYFPPETGQAIEENQKEHSFPSFSKSSVSSFLVTHDIGYLRIWTFDYEGLTKEIEKILTSFSKKDVKKVAIDISDNHGGIVDEAWQAAEFFISEPEKATLRGYRGEIASAPLVALRTAKNKGAWSDTKPVILVNDETASAAELFARVLQLQGVKIIGSRTYGKGRVQKYFDLSNGGGLRLTSFIIYDMLNETYDKGYGGNGVIPDIKTDNPLREALRYLNK